ncbi:MAG: carbohydrate porin [Phycisphaerales bacterium]|nr:MAG: carbohydrate porin [Phycisphaerales bacterium]
MMAYRDALLVSLALVLGLGASARASADAVVNEPASGEELNWTERETLTNGFWGLSDSLADAGIEVAFGSTNVYQVNVKNGLGTHQKSGRFAGSYDLEIAADLEKLCGLAGLGLFVHTEGGWPDTVGIDEAMVGSVSGVNADAGGNRTLDVVEVVFEWSLLDDFLTVMVGKMDMAGVFDASEYANDEAAQFINGALVNNMTIPLPDYCLGAVVSAHLTESWYLAAGVGDAQADGRETGFRTALHGEDYFFYAAETGVATELDSDQGPLPGNYRAGLWYDPQPKANSDRSAETRDDLGFYFSVDQMLIKENDDPEDSQGLGVFARYGYADEKRNDIGSFWSVGVQYQGLLDGRDDDVLGLGYAQSIFSDGADSTFTANHESVLELYYSAQIAPWIAVSPSIQYLANPGGDRDVSNAVVAGVRAQVAF